MFCDIAILFISAAYKISTKNKYNLSSPKLSYIAIFNTIMHCRRQTPCRLINQFKFVAHPYVGLSKKNLTACTHIMQINMLHSNDIITIDKSVSDCSVPMLCSVGRIKEVSATLPGSGSSRNHQLLILHQNRFYAMLTVACPMNIPVNASETFSTTADFIIFRFLIRFMAFGNVLSNDIFQA